MTLLSLLDRLSAADAAAATAPRRHLLRQLGTAGLGAAAAALALATPAQAAPAATTFDALLLLLKLEDLLSALYTQALAPAGVLSNAAQAAVRPDFQRLLQQQQGHAQFLRATLTGATITPPAAPSFDFSGRRNNSANPVLFPNALTDFGAFLQLAQQLEDASASIYLSQATAFTGDKLLLDAVLRMQTVEARHASHIRTLRRAATAAVVKSWPSTADAAPSPAVQVPGATGAPVSIYSYEANESQVASGTTVVPFSALFSGATAVKFVALSEAFDEPLPTPQATALLNIFG